ncbi:Thymidylate kinase [Geodia barretti]|uniref:Thymidylate kinase n=1 Tax=Geodia barretti TaxID=519541 RepID=A0AA35S5E3_GEOBA|nr:Thymidylate kinase [Geodia barretti]
MSGNAGSGLPRSALFLTVEGVEGGGKSTLAQRLGTRLRGEGRRVTLTSEPGGTAAGKVIRQLLLHTDGPLAPETELALFFAARAQNIAEVIRPALLRGEVVISDASPIRRSLTRAGAGVCRWNRSWRWTRRSPQASART